jgi:ABC-type dipeptide/oligopeptide/nickel transport system permease subunit
MLLLVIAVAAAGPLAAPFPLDQPILAPGMPPGGDAVLGTDFLGRDVLSRVLFGGQQLLAVSALSVALAYAAGIIIGMAAGLSRNRVDSLLMRGIDLFMSVPPILLLLVLVTGAGTSDGVLVIGISAVLFPGVARIVRTATLEVSITGYVEAAIARGEQSWALMRREILPNVMPSLIADFGVRSLTAIYLIASLSFLGLGAAPPEANWGLIVAENRSIIATNPFAVLAPAMLIALLTIAVNLIGDAYIESQRRSSD